MVFDTSEPGAPPPAATTSPGEVTRLLHDLQEGDEGAGERLAALVYAELREVAARHLRAERPDHTLTPTALVHEAYLRLAGQQETAWQSRAHFFAMAARAMRRILVDHARARRAAKRSGGERVPLDDASDVIAGADDAQARAIDLVALDDALARLTALDPRQARVVELRYFAGLEIEEVAELLGVSGMTVKRDWRLARAWLFRELGGGDG
jgi:RNA polymerase sigma factor (TIGR02999 family)